MKCMDIGSGWNGGQVGSRRIGNIACNYQHTIRISCALLLYLDDSLEWMGSQVSVIST